MSILIRKIKNTISALKTVVRKRRLDSDFERWSTEQSLSAKWDSRTERIAQLIAPESRVLEFGAGRLVLKKYLPEGCSYTPSDIVDRGEGTLVCDLNAETLPQFDSDFDVCVFSGVLEYLNDAPRLIKHLSAKIPTIITSYATLELKPKLIKRRKSGWVNDYSAAEFKAIFSSFGYVLDHVEEWHSQEIYRFVKGENNNFGSNEFVLNETT